MAKSEVETGDLCRSSDVTVKETYHNRLIHFSALSHREMNFLDLASLATIHVVHQRAAL